MPDRIQLSRRKGWRMPPNTRSVARPSIYGNPYRVGRDGTAAECVARYRADIEAVLGGDIGLHKAVILTLLRDIRGKNLACWCKPGAPCHADVLLDLANRDHSSDARNMPEGEAP